MHISSRNLSSPFYRSNSLRLTFEQIFLFSFLHLFLFSTWSFFFRSHFHFNSLIRSVNTSCWVSSSSPSPHLSLKSQWPDTLRSVTVTDIIGKFHQSCEHGFTIYVIRPLFISSCFYFYHFLWPCWYSLDGWHYLWCNSFVFLGQIICYFVFASHWTSYNGFNSFW